MYAEEDLPAGWLTQFRRGVCSGAGLLLLAVAAGTVPAFLVWLVPGADTTPATSAVKAGALLTLAAAHGGIRLNGESVTLVPLLVTALLAWLVAGQARRSDSWSAVFGLSVGYGLGSGLLARWAELGSTRAPSGRSAVASFAFVLVVGLLARGSAAAAAQVSVQHRRLVRAALAIIACYTAAAALLVAGSLIWHLGDAAALQRQVAPGMAGLPIALLSLAAAPNAVLAGIGYLTGPGFVLGSHTSVSVVSVQHGALPSLPLTAAVPNHSTPLAGILMISVVALVAGWCALRLVGPATGLSRWRDSVAAAVLAGGVLAAATALSSGGIGRGALAHVGASWWAVGGSAICLVTVSSAGWLLVAQLRPGVLGGQRAAEPEPAADRPKLRSVPIERDERASGPGSAARSGADESAKPAGPSRHVS